MTLRGSNLGVASTPVLVSWTGVSMAAAAAAPRAARGVAAGTLLGPGGAIAPGALPAADDEGRVKMCRCAVLTDTSNQ